jgi:hypothetical protein
MGHFTLKSAIPVRRPWSVISIFLLVHRVLRLNSFVDRATTGMDVARVVVKEFMSHEFFGTRLKEEKNNR